MLRPNLRSNARHGTTPLPGPRPIDVSAAIADEGGDTTGSPAVPTMQPSGLRGLRFPQLLENAQIQVDSNQETWYKMQTEIEKRAPRLLNGILSK